MVQYNVLLIDSMEVTPYLADTGNGIEWNGYLEGPDNRTTTSPHNDEGGDPEIEEEERMGGYI